MVRQTARMQAILDTCASSSASRTGRFFLERAFLMILRRFIASAGSLALEPRDTATDPRQRMARDARVGIQRMDQRRPLLNNPNARVAMPVDPTLVALGQAKPPFQIEIVSNLGKRWLRRRTDRPENSSMSSAICWWIGSAFSKRPPTSRNCSWRCDSFPAPGVEGRGDLLEILDILSNRLLLVANHDPSPGRYNRPSGSSCFSANPLFSRPSCVGSTRGPPSTHRPSATRRMKRTPLIIVENATHRRAIVQHDGPADRFRRLRVDRSRAHRPVRLGILGRGGGAGRRQRSR